LTRTFRYAFRALARDYAGSGAGAALCAFLLLAAHPSPWPGAALAACGALFLVYFARTVCRQSTQLELDEAGIRARGPLGGAIRWEDLRALRLDYYSTRRDQEEGWMQLRLSDARTTLRIDSGLGGFADVVEAAARAAAARGLPLDAATAANLELLGR